MNRFSDHYPTGRWEDEIDSYHGLTRGELIHAIRNAHEAGLCDPLACAVCQWEAMRAQAVQAEAN